jgi:two-component system phosphate regulon sensor histidine kinase PhoR
VEHSGLASANTSSAPESRRPPAVRSRWWRSLPWSPVRIVVVYAVVGALWIAFSDHLLTLLVPDPVLRDDLQTVKGWFFVLATSTILYVLVLRGQRNLVRFGTEIRAAVESMVDGVLVVDAGGVVEANQAALDLLGVASKDEVLGSPESFCARFQPRATDGTPIPPADLPSSLALRGQRISREAMIRRADGRDVVLSVSAAPIVAPGGPGGLTIAVFRDVSSAYRLEAMRDEFLATAAHELKTPLAVVKAYAQLVQRRAPNEAPALAVVQRQVDRMTRLVQHLLDASRLRLDPASGPMEPFDLSRLVSEEIERMRATDAGHALTVQVAGPVPVLGDRDRIARVIHSLLDNAVRFSPRGGAIEARVETVELEARVAIQDHGLGIPYDRQARIFERYYRAHAGTPEDYGGLGLSLDLSREIVTRHGGRIWFESAPGQGSTFHFSLPAVRGGAP